MANFENGNIKKNEKLSVLQKWLKSRAIAECHQDTFEFDESVEQRILSQENCEDMKVASCC